MKLNKTIMFYFSLIDNRDRYEPFNQTGTRFSGMKCSRQLISNKERFPTLIAHYML